MVSLDEIIAGVKGTKMLYLEDSYIDNISGCKLLRFTKDKGKRGYIILDKSIFHPKYGGQPSDRGIVRSNNFIFEVKKVLFYKGVLVHWGKNIGENPEKLEFVSCKIDWNFRYRIMRLHTAGHILDYSMYRVYGKTVETTSAFHGPPQPYLAYKAPMPAREILERIEEIANNVVKEGIEIKILWVSKENLSRYLINAPNLKRLPESERYRIVMIDGLNAMPCTGTHVKNTKEIKRIKITGVEKNIDGFKLFYDVD